MIGAAGLTRALGGRWYGRYGTARCVVHDDRQPSLSIVDGYNGPIASCFAGCNRRDIYAELRRRGLLEDSRQSCSTVTRKVNISTQGRPEDREQQQRDKAAWLWARRQPIKGTPAERYLRETRGYSGPLPGTVGFLSPNKPKQHPAMIAAYGNVPVTDSGLVTGPGSVAAVHLTLLRPDGSGKAEVEPNKITVGSPRNRPIVLALINDLLGLGITEGIEDALSVHQSTGLGTWAAGCAPYMPALTDAVPLYIETVTIFAHDDNGKRPALELAERLEARGIETRLEGLAP
jgi:hypothetical protein